jgi:hypothetical protein
MSNNVTMRDTRNAAQAVDALTLPGFAFNAWTPALVNLGSEWQEFVSRRLQAPPAAGQPPVSRAGLDCLRQVLAEGR